MAAGEQPGVIGVFRDRALAEQAINDLRHSGWDTGQVRLVGRNSGGGLQSLRNIFGERDTSAQDASYAEALAGLPEDQRQSYLRDLEAGSYLVIVPSNEHPLETRDILNRYGAYNVFTGLGLGGERTIKLRQEEAQIQKHVVDVGEIRIHKRVITEQRTFTVPVMREEVTIERLPRGENGESAQPSSLQNPPTVQRFSDERYPPTEQTAEMPWTQEEALRDGGSLRILVREEQVVIEKFPVIVEEIIINKRTVQDVKHLVEPIRHEEVRLETIGNAPVHEQAVEPMLPASPIDQQTATSDQSR